MQLKQHRNKHYASIKNVSTISRVRLLEEKKDNTETGKVEVSKRGEVNW